MVKLFLVFYQLKQLHDTIYCQDYAVRVLPVCNIECYGAALYLARQEEEVYPVYYNKKGGSPETINKQANFLELLICKGRLSKPNRVVQLWSRTFHQYVSYLTFVDTLNQIIKISGTVCSQGFCRRNIQLGNILNNLNFIPVFYFLKGF